MRGVIVIIGYNRPKPLKRCFDYVSRAFYPEDDQVDLYFSLDHSDMETEICQMIQSFEWPHGELKVLTHPERMGLKKHVISCGNLIGDHDFLIMLEDDIIVSESFYLYTAEAVRKYDCYEEIGGISLYAREVFQQNGRMFEPVYNGNDVYLMQVAESWGQAWSNRMWKEFYEWYLNHQTFIKPFRMADYSYSWDERSWLKYYMGFVASENKYLVHPYHGYSTNTEEIGENYKTTDTDYQVALTYGQKEFRMPEPENCVRYDAFFERENDPWFSFNYHGEPVLLDLNAARSNYGNYRYLASTRKLNYKIIQTYGLSLRPQEINLINDVQGHDIYLYDLTIAEKNRMPSNNDQITRYNVRAVSWARLSHLGIREFSEHIQKIVRNKKNQLKRKLHRK